MPESVQFRFTRAQNYHLVWANGAFGGATTRGQFKMDFYTEYNATPDTIEHEIRADGGLGRELRREPSERRLVRELQVGVVMTLDQAEQLGQWLLEQTKKAKEVRQKREEQRKSQESTDRQ